MEDLVRFRIWMRMSGGYFDFRDEVKDLEDFIVSVINMNWTFLRVSGDKISAQR